MITTEVQQTPQEKPQLYLKRAYHLSVFKFDGKTHTR